MRIPWLALISAACLVFGSYEIGRRYAASPHPAPATPQVAPLNPPSEPGIKNEDEYLGQVKVVGPLANWMRDAEQRSIGEHEHQQPHTTYKASELDHIIPRPSSAPNNFLHATFPLTTYAAFEIHLPPGTVSASLTGNFEAFTYAAGHQREPADVEVLLLDEPGFHDFMHQHAGSPVYSIDPCSRQSLAWLLNSDYHKVKKYYFVFHNPDTTRQSPSVQADFTLRFN